MFVSDIMPDKLTIAAQYRCIVPVDVTKEDVVARIAKETGSWGGNKVFECSGAAAAFGPLAQCARSGGCITLVGMTSGRSRLTLLPGKSASCE